MPVRLVDHDEVEPTVAEGSLRRAGPYQPHPSGVMAGAARLAAAGARRDPPSRHLVAGPRPALDRHHRQLSQLRAVPGAGAGRDRAPGRRLGTDPARAAPAGGASPGVPGLGGAVATAATGAVNRRRLVRRPGLDGVQRILPVPDRARYDRQPLPVRAGLAGDYLGLPAAGAGAVRSSDPPHRRPLVLVGGGATAAGAGRRYGCWRWQAPGCWPGRCPGSHPRPGSTRRGRSGWRC